MYLSALVDRAWGSLNTAYHQLFASWWWYDEDLVEDNECDPHASY